ncbi:Uncharacterised protein [Streptococcus pneumoniae]|nr:Uncharacterised protein [Streptococcus pneumoniae]
MYQVRRYLDSSFQYLLVLLYLRILHQFLYDTKLEYGVPTIIDEKYTSREYFPSNVNMCFRNALVRTLLSLLLFAEALLPSQQVEPFLRTIVLISKAQQLHHYAHYDLLNAYEARFLLIRPLLVNLLLTLYGTRNDPYRYTYQLFRSSFHLRSLLRYVVSHDGYLLQSHSGHELA